jgi:bifunctional DNase/RNase
MMEVNVKGLTFDPITNVPIVLLKEVSSNRLLPIWIGVFEANAIALEIEKVSTPRPMTHDLLKNFFEMVNSKMLRVEVDNLQDNTFFATIYFEFDGKEVKIDSRPSDAIALALRSKIPIYVTMEVMSKAQSVELDNDIGDQEQWKNWLEQLKPDDFSKYQS